MLSIHQKSFVGRSPPTQPLEELIALPRHPSRIKRSLCDREGREGKEGMGRMEMKEREGGKRKEWKGYLRSNILATALIRPLAQRPYTVLADIPHNPL